jgi:hypothetical protein
MTLPIDYLDAISEARDKSFGPMMIPWPMRGNLGGFVPFSTYPAWRSFVLYFSLRRAAPHPAVEQFERSQKLYILSWIDGDLIFAAELVAWTALEWALTDCYGAKVRRKSGGIHFADLLDYLVTHDGLTDENLPINVRCGGGSVVNRMTKNSQPKPSYADLRNDRAHGKPIGGIQGGLLELVRDLIDHAYRDRSHVPGYNA